MDEQEMIFKGGTIKFANGDTLELPRFKLTYNNYAYFETTVETTVETIPEQPKRPKFMAEVHEELPRQF